MRMFRCARFVSYTDHLPRRMRQIFRENGLKDTHTNYTEYMPEGRRANEKREEKRREWTTSTRKTMEILKVNKINERSTQHCTTQQQLQQQQRKSPAKKMWKNLKRKKDRHENPASNWMKTKPTRMKKWEKREIIMLAWCGVPVCCVHTCTCVKRLCPFHQKCDIFRSGLKLPHS